MPRRRITEQEAFAVCKKCPYILNKDDEFYCDAQCPNCKLFSGRPLRQVLKALNVAIISCPKGFW